MQLAILEDFLFRIIKFLKYEDHIVGISDSSELSEGITSEIIAKKDEYRSWPSLVLSLENEILFDKIKGLEFTDLLLAVENKKFLAVEEGIEYLKNNLKIQENIHIYSAASVKEILQTIDDVGNLVGKKSQAIDLSHRYKAQLINWIDSYYERLKNKRVLVLRNVEPFEVYGLWVADLVNLSCAKNLITSSDHYHTKTSWDEIYKLKPDTIIIAPHNKNLNESLKTFKILEKLPNWEYLPAVKRTEVYFCDGTVFQDPLRAINEGAAYIISCIAGLESGDICKRDSFRRLRWVEIYRPF